MYQWSTATTLYFGVGVLYTLYVLGWLRGNVQNKGFCLQISVGPNTKFRPNTEYRIYSGSENTPNTEYIRVLKMDRIRIPNSAIRSQLFE